MGVIEPDIIIRGGLDSIACYDRSPVKINMLKAGVISSCIDELDDMSPVG
jgi:hypothetical protein